MALIAAQTSEAAAFMVWVTSIGAVGCKPLSTKSFINPPIAVLIVSPSKSDLQLLLYLRNPPRISIREIIRLCQAHIPLMNLSL